MSAHASTSQPALRWVTVFQGSPGAALAAQAALQSAGIPTYLPDYNLKLLDPFITGGNALAVSVQVPSDAEAAAADIVAESAAVGPADSERGDATARETEPSSALAASAEGLRALGQRVIFASLAVITAPIAFFWAVRYLRETRRLGVRPENHGWVLAATAFAALACVGEALLVAQAGGAFAGAP